MNAPKPGNQPSVTAVIKFLKSAGFQHSRYTDAVSAPTGSGANVRAFGDGTVIVHWHEGDHDFFRRMTDVGAEHAADVPQHPQAEARAQEYADALAPRYTVKVSGTHVYVTARKELPARPAGVPTATTVRKALTAAGVASLTQANSRAFSVVDQPDHTRVAAFDAETLAAVRDALETEGWIFEESETSQHYTLKITGATADRPARLRKLRAERAATEAAPADQYAEQTKEQQQAAAEPAPAPASRPAVAEEQPTAAEPASEAQPPVYGPDGRAYRIGQRVTFRTSDGFLYTGPITGFGKEDGEGTTVTLNVDTRQVGPPSRVPKGMSARPGRARPVEPPQEWTRLLGKITPAKEQ